MKYFSFIFSLLFTTSLLSQSNFSADEIKILESKKESPSYFKVNTDTDDLEYYSPKIINLPLTSVDYGYVSILRFYLTKKNDEIMLKPLLFKQKITKNGISIDYDKMVCIVGNSKDIKYGKYKKFELIPTVKNQDGSIIIDNEDIYNMFLYSITEFKNIEFKYINKRGEVLFKLKLQASKIKSKFKGILNTYKEFKKEFKPYKVNETSSSKDKTDFHQSAILCDGIIIKPDKFTGDTTYYSSYDDVMFIKIKKSNDVVKYFMRLKTTGLTANVNLHGVIVLLENGNKIVKENAEVKVDVNDDAEYVYTSFFELSIDELDLLINNNITDYRLYIYDTTLSEYESNKYNALLKCLL